MRVLIIGGHHGVGAHLAQLARTRAWDVSVFEGDVLEVDTVRHAVSGKHLVLSTLGPRRSSSARDVCSQGSRNIVAAMRAHAVRRLVQVTGAMIGHPRARLGLVYRLIVSFVPKPMLEDRQQQERLIMQSGLDWTLVRPTRLTDGSARGQWRDGETELVRAFAHISRADVAAAMLQAATDEKTIGRALTLQY